jgi:hypothetical protein
VKIYISGAISNCSDYRERFQKAEKWLIENWPDHEIINPVKIGSEKLSWEQNMRVCISALMECDIIFLLDNWKNSKGAMIELHLAKNLRMPVLEEVYQDAHQERQKI